MRSDMHKVVVERERHGSTRRNRKWGTRIAYVPDADYDDQPKFVPSARGRQYGYDHKWFSDVLGPLKGFLRSNVGCPWDKVFSELHEGLDVRKVTGRHIFDHGEWMVETECWLGADCKVYGYPRMKSLVLCSSQNQAFVLCSAAQRTRAEETAAHAARD